MRIVSWNIRQGGGSRSKEIVEQLKRWNPTIVGLCEFRGGTASKSISETLREMGLTIQHATSNPKRPSEDRLLIASKLPFEVRRPQGELGSSGRWIHVHVDSRRPFDFVLMWVPNRREACTKPVFHREVLAALGPYSESSAIAMGDTNTGVPGVDEDSDYFTKKEGQWLQDMDHAGWIDVWRKKHPTGREFTWRTNGGKNFRIDQLFATNTMLSRVKSVEYEWGKPPMGKQKGPSDHAAIVAEITE